ncbi:peptidoglycan-binding LysM [Enterococcus faecium U0317]|nr:peptidoglycan-binding LysM [Enterococcus faecium U0317]
MTSLKTLLFGTTLAAGAAFFMGTTAHADEAYTVQSGDTLSTISQKYVGDNSLINAIAESNSISDINLIYSGQQLTIPTEGSAQAAAEPQAAVQEAPVQAELFKLNNLLYKKRFKRKNKQRLLLKHNLLLL